MATYTAAHVKATDLSAVSAHLTNWLAVTHSSEVVVGDGSFPPDFYASGSFLNSEENPTRFALASQPSGWITAYFNSFSELHDLAPHLSTAFNTTVLVVLAQSVSEAYFVAVYECGAHLRTLYWAGDTGDWYKTEGQPLPFERSYERFERDELIEFCKSLGLPIWSASDALAWRELRAVPTVRPSAKKRAHPRPWWQFWRFASVFSFRWPYRA